MRSKEKLTLLWDNDGVLVETEPLYFKASKLALKEAGIDLTQEQYQEISLRQGGSIFELARPNGYSDSQIKDLRRNRNTIYSHLLSTELQLRAGIKDCLDAVAPHCRMGIVTSSLREHFDIIHSQSGLRPYFEFVYSRESFDRPKPYPDAYLKAVEAEKISEEKCLVVEDSERGLRAAKSAGLTCFVVLSDLTKDMNFSGADQICGDIFELKERILEWVSGRQRNDERLTS